jgi:gamma-resorcylate decarboxylase
MNGKIGLEEHFAVDGTVMDSKGFIPEESWTELRYRLLDIHRKRLELMDRYGIERMILSLNAPAVQAIPDVNRAIEVARIANDVLAEEVAKRSDRFSGLAALPMQDPEAAAQELTRCIKELRFVGALVNGFSQVREVNSTVYYDLPQYQPFWQVVATLDAPFYLHPRNPLNVGHPEYEGHRWLVGPTWAFAHETAVHALRLMAGGVFDKYPTLKIILGHLGEGIPYNIWRIDNRLRWSPQGYSAMKLPGEYFLSNFWITTSGNFRTQTLIDAILEIGADRILFSTDYPFEEVNAAAEWFDRTSISEADRLKIGRLNAEKLFKL